LRSKGMNAWGKLKGLYGRMPFTEEEIEEEIALAEAFEEEALAWGLPPDFWAKFRAKWRRVYNHKFNLPRINLGGLTKHAPRLPPVKVPTSIRQVHNTAKKVWDKITPWTEEEIALAEFNERRRKF